MARLKPSEHTVKVLVRIEPRIQDWLRQRAQANGTTVTEQIRTVFNQQIARDASEREAQRAG